MRNIELVLIHSQNYYYITGRTMDIHVIAGVTRVSLGAPRNEISMIQACVPRDIVDDTRTDDSLVKINCF